MALVEVPESATIPTAQTSEGADPQISFMVFMQADDLALNEAFGGSQGAMDSGLGCSCACQK